MPRHQTNHGFNLATIVQVGAIPILTVAFYFIGNYFLTNSTLTEHSKAIAQIEKLREKDTTEAKNSREKTVAQFMDYQQKTTEILGKLDTRLAISETKQDTTNQTLSKIADEIVKMNTSRK